MATDRSTAALVGALVKLRGELDGASLRLQTPDVEDARVKRVNVVDQLEDYILPRLVQLDAPLLTVVGGSTGAGKSTLVNTLVGTRVTESGVLRPTTRSPVLVHNPEDAHWFAPERILPDLARTNSPSTDIGALRLVAADTVPPGLAILDAPDVDSVDEANREMAAQLLAAADLWLFVTSAARYADQVPWTFLQAASERSTAVAIVLDRTPPESIAEVRVHLARMLTARGLKDSPLFSVLEGKVDESGLLDPKAVAPIHDWLYDLAADSEVRAMIISQTLEGAVRQTVFSAHDVADAVAQQDQASAQLHRDVENAYALAMSQVQEATADGTLLRGEVLARWQDFVGTGDLIRSLEERVGRIRDRVVDGLRGKRDKTREVSEAVEQGLYLLLLEHAESAAEASVRSWSSVDSGRVLLESGGAGLDRASRDFRVRAERAVRDWQSAVLDLVRNEGADKRMTARFLAFGVNGVGVALMVVVFSQTAGLTGSEAGIGGGTALVGQKLLEAIFGDQAVRRLAQQAHRDLIQRTQGLFDSEKERYLTLLASADAAPDAADNIRDAARACEDARHTDLTPDDWDE